MRQGVTDHSFFFFFSSRRRHTRCGRDWSSDVCSSDLSSRGVAKLVKAPDFDSGMRGFESFLPCQIDRKSTRLNSSHVRISYAVFCLKKTIELHSAHLRQGWQQSRSDSGTGRAALSAPG